jgi:hypothetical protein
MATRNGKGSRPEARLPGEADVETIYRAAASAGPAPALDARILSAARDAVEPPRRRHSRWMTPLSTAAVVVLALGVVLLMTRQGALDHRGERAVPNEYAAAPPSPPPAEPARRAEPETTAVAKARPAAPAADAVEERRKLAEPPAARVLDRRQEAAPARPMREESMPSRMAAAGVMTMEANAADVVAVEASGPAGAYEFNVTVKSPDTGCRQYADWWEVLSEDGKLLYRRVLLHSHVDEQPFTRSGGPVPIQPHTVVWVRAHLSTAGYGGKLFKGSVRNGFAATSAPAGFAAGLAQQPPLPDGCAF